jgi:hypothetical protein
MTAPDAISGFIAAYCAFHFAWPGGAARLEFLAPLSGACMGNANLL